MTEPESKGGLSRRALLRSGLAGIGLVAISGTAIALRGTKLRAMPRGGLRVLSPAEYAILAAIAERVCPQPAPGVPGARRDSTSPSSRIAMFENAEPEDASAGREARRCASSRAGSWARSSSSG